MMEIILGLTFALATLLAIFLQGVDMWSDWNRYKGDTVFYSGEWKPYIIFDDINLRQ